VASLCFYLTLLIGSDYVIKVRYLIVEPSYLGMRLGCKLTCFWEERTRDSCNLPDSSIQWLILRACYTPANPRKCCFYFRLYYQGEVVVVEADNFQPADWYFPYVPAITLILLPPTFQGKNVTFTPMNRDQK